MPQAENFFGTHNGNLVLDGVSWHWPPTASGISTFFFMLKLFLCRSSSSDCCFLLVSVSVTMLLTRFVKYSEYCSNLEPPFFIAPARLSNYPHREPTIPSESAVTWLAMPNSTEFLAALDFSAAEIMPPKVFPYYPQISASCMLAM